MEKEIKIFCCLYIDKFSDEEPKEAVERLKRILNCEGISYKIDDFEIRDK